MLAITAVDGLAVEVVVVEAVEISWVSIIPEASLPVVLTESGCPAVRLLATSPKNTERFETNGLANELEQTKIKRTIRRKNFDLIYTPT